MPRPARPWFRVYVEMFPDRKIRRLTPTQRWIWVALMGAARDSPRAPKLYIAEDEPMTLREIADYADVKEREVEPALDAMRKLGMVEIADGVVSLPNFAGRQFESDDVSKRTRAHRERSHEQRKNVPKNVRRNTPETETETDTEKTMSEPSRLDVESICTHLADKIAANGSKRPNITDSWRTSARLMIDLDKRPLEQIHKAIDWCQADEFWRANVLSVPKLREKFDQLRLAAQRSTNGRPPEGQRPQDLYAQLSQPRSTS